MTIELETGAAGDDRFRKAFAQVQRSVRQAPYDRALPPPEHWEKHVQLGGADASFWIARRAGTPVGRIGATISPTRAGAGYVGYFEAADGGDPTIAVPLMDTAFAWLRIRGVEKAYGPIDRSTWYGYRYRVESRPGDVCAAHEEPFAWEPWQPAGYVDAFATAGFVEVERYYSHGYRGVDGMHVKDAAELVSGAADMAKSQGYVLEPFSTNWEEVLPDLYAVGNVCFARNFLFEPIGFEEFRALYDGVGTKVDYRPSAWLVDAAGVKRGFIFAYVDRGYVVMKTVGVAPELRRGGLSLALLWFACDRCVALGHDGTIGALLKQGNNSEGLLRNGFAGATAWRHDYALYERPLTP